VAELIVGRVLSVDDHPGARAPSYLLRVDLGGRGERDAQMEPGSYTRDELVGSLVVLSIDDEAIVLAAHAHTGLRLVRPDGDVEPGTVVA
jgi:tRNA-binding EMAP/Myf-like protein